MRYMKKETLTVAQVASALGVSHDMVNRWWKQGIIKGHKKNPFARNSPILIPASELVKLKKAYAEKK